MSQPNRFSNIPGPLLTIMIAFACLPLWSMTFAPQPWKLELSQALFIGALFWAGPALIIFSVWRRLIITLPLFLLECVGLLAYAFQSFSQDSRLLGFNIAILLAMGVLGIVLLNKDILYPFLTKRQRGWRSVTRFTSNYKLKIKGQGDKTFNAVLQDCSANGLGIIIDKSRVEEIFDSLSVGDALEVIIPVAKGEKVTVQAKLARWRDLGEIREIGFAVDDTEKMDQVMANVANRTPRKNASRWLAFQMARTAVRRSLMAAWALAVVGTFGFPACGAQNGAGVETINERTVAGRGAPGRGDAAYRSFGFDSMGEDQVTCDDFDGICEGDQPPPTDIPCSDYDQLRTDLEIQCNGHTDNGVRTPGCLDQCGRTCDIDWVDPEMHVQCTGPTGGLGQRQIGRWTCECGNGTCGDGLVRSDEECDDGNLDNGDGCSSYCEVEVCGDNRVVGAEQCDDGDLNGPPPAACSNTCQAYMPECGDNVFDPGAGEECDDGNMNDGDGCSSMCEVEVCGNNRVDYGEQCDNGDANGPPPQASCNESCRVYHPTCGDNILDTDAGEICDDGNMNSGDGCSAMCEGEVCGNNVVDYGEQCDDGNTTNDDGCDSQCNIEMEETMESNTGTTGGSCLSSQGALGCSCGYAHPPIERNCGVLDVFCQSQPDTDTTLCCPSPGSNCDDGHGTACDPWDHDPEAADSIMACLQVPDALQNAYKCVEQIDEQGSHIPIPGECMQMFSDLGGSEVGAEEDEFDDLNPPAIMSCIGKTGEELQTCLEEKSQDAILDACGQVLGLPLTQIRDCIQMGVDILGASFQEIWNQAYGEFCEVDHSYNDTTTSSNDFFDTSN